jgi:hypothetical protein
MKLRSLLLFALVSMALFANATATFNANSSVTLTTSNLARQGISITFTKYNPDGTGSATGGTWEVGGLVSYLNSTTQLNYNVQTFADGSAGPGTGNSTAASSVYEVVGFTNNSAAMQTFSVTWGYNITGSVTTDGNGSANAQSKASMSQGLIGGITIFSKGVFVSTPAKLADSAGTSGTLNFTFNPGGSDVLYLSESVSGRANSRRAGPAPGPAAALAFLAPVFRLAKRKRGYGNAAKLVS